MPPSWHWTDHSGGNWQQAEICTELVQADDDIVKSFTFHRKLHCCTIIAAIQITMLLARTFSNTENHHSSLQLQHQLFSFRLTDYCSSYARYQSK